MSDKHMTVKILDIDTTEEMVMNPDAFPEELRGWRYYRIEYGGCNEDCLYEGRVLLPRHADPNAITDMIMGMQAREEMWDFGD